MIARQMYSEKSNAAVCSKPLAHHTFRHDSKINLSFCQLHVLYLIALPASISICLPMAMLGSDASSPVSSGTEADLAGMDWLSGGPILLILRDVLLPCPPGKAFFSGSVESGANPL